MNTEQSRANEPQSHSHSHQDHEPTVPLTPFSPVSDAQGAPAAQEQIPARQQQQDPPASPAEPLTGPTSEPYREPSASHPAPQRAGHSRPRTGPIVWGAIVLLICVYAALQLVAPGGIDTTTFVIFSTIGLGLLLLIVGGAVVVRNTRNK